MMNLTFFLIQMVTNGLAKDGHQVTDRAEDQSLQEDLERLPELPRRSRAHQAIDEEQVRQKVDGNQRPVDDGVTQQDRANSSRSHRGKWTGRRPPLLISFRETQAAGELPSVHAGLQLCHVPDIHAGGGRPEHDGDSLDHVFGLLYPVRLHFEFLYDHLRLAQLLLLHEDRTSPASSLHLD
ncbi:uncharacterized protein LOC128766239 isoform X2 [Synchiropus splendidus]|uniref:uncharacterized protein LOC128766239 isoform X2 n=1 Tax=Synchiropus splendidus TaxID=270530 RepID=UPI00237D3B11|nr:uncharacterized protein LOC128766239 isoform X2 [Synchiropus splendidus]